MTSCIEAIINLKCRTQPSRHSIVATSARRSGLHRAQRMIKYRQKIDEGGLATSRAEHEIMELVKAYGAIPQHLGTEDMRWSRSR